MDLAITNKCYFEKNRQQSSILGWHIPKYTYLTIAVLNRKKNRINCVACFAFSQESDYKRIRMNICLLRKREGITWARLTDCRAIHCCRHRKQCYFCFEKKIQIPIHLQNIKVFYFLVQKDSQCYSFMNALHKIRADFSSHLTGKIFFFFFF